MNYINEIFLRANIQQIRAFLLHGTEGNTDPRRYEERIASVDNALIDRLRRDYPDENDFEEIIEPIYDYITVIEEVYMEIGLQVGAMLASQTSQNLKTAYTG